MSAGNWPTVVIALCASLVVTGAEAAAKKRAKVESPLLRGCTISVPPFCAGIVAGGKTYTLFGANPAIPAGIGVDVYGTIGGVSPCFGIPVQVTSWKRNRVRCPAS